VLTLIDSGVRRGGALALDSDDVNFHSGAIHVRRGKDRKTRVNYVGAKTHRALLCWGGGKRRSAIFPLTPSGGATLMTRFSRKSGVHITFHMCRRTFAHGRSMEEWTYSVFNACQAIQASKWSGSMERLD